jgi:hypothetical protein
VFGDLKALSGASRGEISEDSWNFVELFSNFRQFRVKFVSVSCQLQRTLESTPPLTSSQLFALPSSTFQRQTTQLIVDVFESISIFKVKNIRRSVNLDLSYIVGRVIVVRT